MNDERPWWAATRYKAPLPRHFFRDKPGAIPSTVLAGVLPLPWVALIMQMGSKANLLLQQKYMLTHAEACRQAIEQALAAYDVAEVEFMDCETEAAYVAELYADTREVAIQRRSA